MKILGVSGSPIKDGNTDRALRIVLEATGAKTEFFRLADLNITPCTACLGCRKTNRCVLEDDGVMLAEKAYKADALVVAGFTPYASLDARTKTFLERLYPLHHQHGLMSDKPGAAILTTAVPPEHPDMPDGFAHALAAIRHYMMAENMRFVGAVHVQGNIPCIACGDGGQCGSSTLRMLHGRTAVPSEIPLNDLDNHPETVAALEKLGADLVETYFTVPS